MEIGTIAGLHRKAVWYGDCDNDGTRELLVATNEVLNPEYLPPRTATSRDDLVRTSIRAMDIDRYYAPYFRLLVYRLRESGTDLIANYNTYLPAVQHKLVRIVQDPTDNGTISIEARNTRTGRVVRSRFAVQGPLPRTALKIPGNPPTEPDRTPQ